ncbi:MAG: hypothetical protein LBI78_01215 [Campylobacteraceae bacterium]|jgi:hypothetical protein|nr:hypothetical protein [Campylobacteraceae bacterium]
MQNLQIVDEANALFLGKFKKFSSLFLSLGCLLGFLLIFILAGCGGESSSNSGTRDHSTGEYTINFYDSNLDFNQSIVILSEEIDLAQLITDYDLPTPLYEANSSIDISTYTNYSITGNVNFYGIPNVQEIQTGVELNNIRNNLSGKYILLDDIALNEILNTAAGWTPIGDITNGFTGIFNGNNHKIIGLYANVYSYSTHVGLFGHISKAQIKNLGVEIDNLNGGVKGQQLQQNVGGIAGFVNGSSITNSYTTGDVSGGNGVGGIAGYIGYNSNITNSYSTGNIKGVDLVGGIAGMIYSGGNIINSHSYGNISGTRQVGGIVGQTANYGSNNIINSHSTGNVKGTYYIGGITGSFDGGNSNISIINSYSTGNISGDQWVGGIAGLTFRRITNSYSTGDINGTYYIGGVVGYSSPNSNITNSYSTGNVNGDTYVGGITGEFYRGTMQHNVAINQAINGNNANRIVGNIHVDNIGGGTLSDNIALDSMLVNGSDI